MNRTTLWLVDVGLLVLALVVTAWVWGRTPEAVPADSKSDAKTVRGERKADRKGAMKDAASSAVPAESVSAEDADVLWQETLFRPDRTEDTTQAASENPSADGVALNLELVGLARIGERAVAIIVQYRGQPRRTAPVVAGGPAAFGGHRPGARNPVAPAAAAEGQEASDGPPDRHVYKVGDKVGDSGYSLKEIRFQEKEVVLVRGSEERVLKLETGDDQSAGRRETAAAVAAAEAKAAVKPPAEAAAAPVAQKPPAEAAAAMATAAAAGRPAPPSGGAPPPPPAGLMGAAAAGGSVPAVPGKELPTGATMTREERLERARLLRERILQGRSQTDTTN